MISQEYIQGNWQQFQGKVKKQWGALTDDDLLQSRGNSDILIGKLTERYGITKEQASEKWNQFVDQFDEAGNELKSFADKISRTTENVSDWAFERVKRSQQKMQESPLKSLGIAAGLGALIGACVKKFFEPHSKK